MDFSIFDLIGQTPLVRLNNFESEFGIKARLFAKLEYFNPFGSIKDRVAFQIIDDAEKNGILKHNSHIIEASSGNMGIALSAISNVKNYNCTIVMPDSTSIRKIDTIKSYGAQVILTNGNQGMDESIKMAKYICQIDKKYFYCDQFNNYSSVKAHFLTTAKEISNQLDKIDYIVCGIGSGGTVMGLNKYFANSQTKIYGVLPIKSDYIEGIGAGFISSILSSLVYNNSIKVSAEESEKSSLDLIKSEGIWVGKSSGAVLAACRSLIANNEEYNNKSIVLIFADNGEKYSQC